MTTRCFMREVYTVPMSRNYQPVIDRIRTLTGDTETRMQGVADALWDAFNDDGYSWVGFYLADESKPAAERLILGPRRDKPACSPIGLHGVRGARRTSGEIQIIRDVRELGENYVACDPRDLSEIVVPLLDDAGKVWAELDTDSYDVGSFDESDAAGLCEVLSAAGFTPSR